MPSTTESAGFRTTDCLGDFCEILRGSRFPFDSTASLDDIPFIRGADIARDILPQKPLTPKALPADFPEDLCLRTNDIVLPTVSRHPRVRIIDDTLAGYIAHHTVMVLRPNKDGPSVQQIADYITSPRFFDQISKRVSLLHDAVRFTADALATTPFPMPKNEETPSNSVVILMEQLARELIRLIAQEREVLWKIEWREVERVIAVAFDGLGFDVKLTPPTKDGGKDIVLSCVEKETRKQYAIEVKHWVSGQRVRGVDLRKFLEVVVNEQHDSGLFLSTSGFAHNAYQAIAHLEHKRIRLAGADKMISVCQLFVRAESGMWIPNQGTSQILFDGTTPVIV